MDDAALLQRARQGDEPAFSELFERHQRAIYRYAVVSPTAATTCS
jgi:DNA-directed RNA polymerase specialized sigma24 family protein